MRRFASWIPMLLLAAACGDETPTAPTPITPMPVTPPAFSMTDLRVGDGAPAAAGQTLDVAYVGWLYDPGSPENKGQQFDQGTIAFVLGQGTVIRGWDEGLVGLRVGGIRRLIIPPDLAYGAAGRPPRIPGNATLLFEVELLRIR